MEHQSHEGEIIKDYLDDLRKVGPSKPLGYLPLPTIEKFAPYSAEGIAEERKRNGQEVLQLSEDQCHVTGGALYVYDREVLQRLLDEHTDILTKWSWPTSADEFVLKLATETATPKTALFDLVADSFADNNNPGRTDSPAID